MITAAFYDTKPYDRKYFEHALYHENVNWRFHEFRLTAQTVTSAAGIDAVCVFVNDRLDHSCIAQLAKYGVKLIALRCAGFNNIDLKAAKEFGFVIVRVPAYSPHAIAEHAISLLLTLNRRIHRAHNRVREHNFSLNGLIGFNLAGKTVGIIGTGKIGRIAAKIYRGFDCRVIANDIIPDPHWAAQYDVEYTTLAMLLHHSDIISLHLPLTPDTFHFICHEAIMQMKKNVYLINTSRGKLIDTTALLAALKEGHFGGVALDVYEKEEGIFFENHSERILKDDDLNLLLSYPNVLITSHQAFLTHEALNEIARITTENIFRFEVGQQPLDDTAL